MIGYSLPRLGYRSGKVVTLLNGSHISTNIYAFVISLFCLSISLLKSLRGIPHRVWKNFKDMLLGPCGQDGDHKPQTVNLAGD